jgi:hypothetical protein
MHSSVVFDLPEEGHMFERSMLEAIVYRPVK